MTITASSNQPKNYRYRLLDEIFRDACSDPFIWEDVPKTESGELFYSQRRNTVTGDTITCQGHVDGLHSFTFEQVEKCR